MLKRPLWKSCVQLVEFAFEFCSEVLINWSESGLINLKANYFEICTFSTTAPEGGWVYCINPLTPRRTQVSPFTEIPILF